MQFLKDLIVPTLIYPEVILPNKNNPWRWASLCAISALFVLEQFK